MFNINNNNNSISAQNIWDQMALFNQLTLRNILNGRNNLGTPKLRATLAAMSDEQRDDALVFLECITEELAGLNDGCGIQAVANVRNCWTTFQQIYQLPLHGDMILGVWIVHLHFDEPCQLYTGS